MAKAPAATRERRLTPLWIISLFVGLTEAVLAVALVRVTGSIQVALTAFVIVFPLLIATAFFVILWNRPWVFYAPTEYGGTDPTQFVQTLAAVRGGKITVKTADLPAEVKVIGYPDNFVLLFKAAAAKWSKSTKAMDIGTGCIVQVSTEHLTPDGGVSVAEAVTFVPGAKISDDERGGGKRLISAGKLQ
jgi:hypothetical protein